MIKVALLQCKSGAIAAKNGLLALSFFAHSAHQPPNPLCLNRLSLHAQNSRISHQSAQQGVLSVRNANIVFGRTAEELGIRSFELRIARQGAL